jgi:hypothetical protein
MGMGTPSRVYSPVPMILKERVILLPAVIVMLLLEVMTMLLLAVITVGSVAISSNCGGCTNNMLRVSVATLVVLVVTIV